MTEKKLVVCNCGNVEHQFILAVDEEFDIVYLEIHLTKKNFFNRLKHGLKYIFGYQSKYGAFDEIILDKECVEELQKWFLDVSRNMKYVKTDT
jgi:hypothetical protein